VGLSKNYISSCKILSKLDKRFFFCNFFWYIWSFYHLDWVVFIDHGYKDIDWFRLKMLGQREAKFLECSFICICYLRHIKINFHLKQVSFLQEKLDVVVSLLLTVHKHKTFFVVLICPIANWLYLSLSEPSAELLLFSIHSYYAKRNNTVVAAIFSKTKSSRRHNG